MFNWCKDAKVVNVYNDYHYYIDHSNNLVNQQQFKTIRPPKLSIPSTNKINSINLGQEKRRKGITVQLKSMK
jgi:hypothetical protein